MNTFLVTGGAGFIGSHLAEALTKRGDAVVVLDDFSTGKRENLAHLAEKVRVIEGSITDPDVCQQAVAGVDYVLHEAALPSVPRSVEDPLTANDANITGTLNMLVAARDAGVKRFVYAASSAAYGDTPTLPKVETMLPNPLSPYAVGKLTGEMYCEVFHGLYGLETVALRYFNVFGPRQDPESQYAAVIPKFVTLFFQNESPLIHGDGEQSRDFTHVDNVVHANLLACQAPKAAAGQVFNCACGENMTLNELAGILQELTGSDAAPQHGPPRPGDIKHSTADIAKVRDLLGFEPCVTTRQGLEQVVAWYRDAG